MHTNWCVFIEISKEIGMLNFLSGIIGHCTEGRISLYSYDVSKSWHAPSLNRMISTHQTGRLESKSSSVRQKPLICFRSDIETKTQIGRYFHECQPKPHFKGKIYLPVWGIFFFYLDPILHYLSKKEKCPSLAPPRGNSFKT